MHESTMTQSEMRQLRAQICAFHRAFRGRKLPLSFARRYFELLGHRLTRPIEHTLQAHGVAGRPEARFKWPHPLRSQPWRVERRQLVPA